MPRSRRIVSALVVALAFAVPMTAQAHTYVGPPKLAWLSPTPQNGATVNVTVGQTLSVAFAAHDVLPTALVHISANALPAGAALNVVDGNPGTATLQWTPTAAQAGTYNVTLVATDNLPIPIKSVPLYLTIVVKPLVGTETTLTTGYVTKWAFVSRSTVARVAPSSRARKIVKVPAWTPENFPNLLLLYKQRYVKGGWWVQARLSSLPNGRIGWVPRRALGSYHDNHMHLYVKRSSFTATLQKDGATIFTTRVGVGKSYWPTPRGEFYIREKITGFRNPMYGPIAYGTSARSAVLTDWPGGGFIGVHGTNEPGLIPGRISHGCIRMRNSSILKLSRLLVIGTPLTVS